MLQLDDSIIEALHIYGFEIAIESNCTLPVNPKIDWICISPKMGATLVQRSGDELKLVFPQQGLNPSQFEEFDFRHFFLQPMDNSDYQANLQKAIEYCMAHPKWRLSLQTHKLIGIP
jgi:organic radical activating enzyme